APRRGVVLDVSEVDRHAALLLRRGAIELIVASSLTAVTSRHHGREGSRQRGLAVVDVTDGSNVDEWLTHVSSPAGGRPAVFTPTCTDHPPCRRGPKMNRAPRRSVGGPAFAYVLRLSR